MKNNKTILALALALVFGLVACAQNKKGESKMNENVNKHVLVAYFSATGTTKEAATQLAKAANADLYEIVPEIRLPCRPQSGTRQVSGKAQPAKGA